MPSISLSLFILGLVASSVAENETSTVPSLSTASSEFTSNVSYSMTTLTTVTDVTSIGEDATVLHTDVMNVTEGNSTMPMLPSTTKQKGGEMSSTTPKTIHPSKSTVSTTTKGNLKDKTTHAAPDKSGGDRVGITILIVIIIIALGCGVACYFARKRGRRYSVDFQTSRPDEANIPLSTMEPTDTAPQNGLQTFESTATTKEPQETEAKPEVQEEQKAEADKSVVDPSAESAAPAPSADSSGDKPKEDVVEQSPPAPVEPTAEEKTDDEGVVSNKTSVESLKEANENNSNNADFSQKRDLKTDNVFWEVPLDCPV